MITLTILLGLALVGALVIGTVGVSFVAAYADIAIAVLIVYAIYKLFSKKESKK